MNNMDIEKRLEALEKLVRSSFKEVLSVKDAAAMMGLSESRLRHKMSAGEIPFYRNGRKVYIKKSELESCMLRTKVKSNYEIKQDAATYAATR